MRPLFRNTLAGLALAALAGAISGPAAAQTPPNVLIVGQIAEPKSLDPSVDTAVNDFRILMNMYDGLVRYKDGTLEPEPALAESWEISDDGTTYSVDVFYRYEVDGIRHASNRWRLMGGSSSGRKGKQEVVNAHPPGTAITCYVDPDRPWRAIVRRELGWWTLFGLFPLPFLAVGLGGLWATFRRKQARDEVERVTSPEPLRTDRPGDFGSSRGKRVAALVGAVILAAFWNGIVSVFVWQAWKGFQTGRPEWLLTVFMVPFVLIGLALLLHVPYRLLAIFSPHYRMTLSSERLKPGARATLGWKRAGGGGEPRRLSLWLVGREEAVYQRGTRRVTASSVFHERELFSTESPPMMPGGRCDLPVPRDAIPSFRGRHNQLRWFVRLVVDVPWRPDVHEEHEIEVLPLEPEDLRS